MSGDELGSEGDWTTKPGILILPVGDLLDGVTLVGGDGGRGISISAISWPSLKPGFPSPGLPANVLLLKYAT